MRKGIELLEETLGDGEPLQRQHVYRMRLRMWLHRGDPVRWQRAWGPINTAELSEDGTTLTTDLRVDRENLIAGLFQGMQGMCVGGTRKLRIAPHLAYGEHGVPGSVPAHALIVAEVTVLAELKSRRPRRND